MRRLLALGLALLLGVGLGPAPLGAQLLETGDKGVTPGGKVTSTDVSPTVQALDVYIRGGAGAGGTSQGDDTPVSTLTGIGALYDTSPPAITDGHVGLPVMDSSRRLRIICEGGCGGASPFEDEDAFTLGTTAITILGGVVDETTPDSAPENSAAAPRMAPNRVLYQILRDALGNERGAAVDAANRLSVAVGNTVTVSGTVTVTDGAGAVTVDGTTFDGILRDGAGDTTQANVSSGRVHVDGSGVTQPISAAALPLPAGAATAALQDGIVKDGAGDTTQANVSSGRLHVDGSGVTQPVSGTVTANQGGAPWSVAGPAADGAAVSGNPVRIGGKDGSGNTQDIATDTSGELQIDVLTLPNEGQQTAANSISVTPDTDNDAVGATAAAPPGEAMYVGGLQSGATGGLLGGLTICDSYANVNVVTATTTLLVTGVSGRHVRICSLSLVTAGANNVALISGTGATCGTGTTGMTGGTTAATGYNFAANGGLAQGSGIGVINQTNATGDSVCVVTSAAVQLSGRIGYAIH
jgi:hypothetical protein